MSFACLCLCLIQICLNSPFLFCQCLCPKCPLCMFVLLSAFCPHVFTVGQFPANWPTRLRTRRRRSNWPLWIYRSTLCTLYTLLAVHTLSEWESPSENESNQPLKSNLSKLRKSTFNKHTKRWHWRKDKNSNPFLCLSVFLSFCLFLYLFPFYPRVLIYQNSN